MLRSPLEPAGKNIFIHSWRKRHNAVRIDAAEQRQTLGVLQVANAMRG